MFAPQPIFYTLYRDLTLTVHTLYAMRRDFKEHTQRTLFLAQRRNQNILVLLLLYVEHCERPSMKLELSGA